MNKEQLQRAAEEAENMATLDHLIADLEKSTAEEVAMSVTEVGDGPLMGDGDDTFVERGGLIEYLKAQRAWHAEQLRGLGVECE